MKKVLSVAMASAMVLGMGANAFAIQYSTGSNEEAAWPSDFKFDGSLFVTDKDGNIVESTLTDLNGKTRVDFQPGDVIWMPLYADNQRVYEVVGNEDGTSAVDARTEYLTVELDQNGNAPAVSTDGTVYVDANGKLKPFTYEDVNSKVVYYSGTGAKAVAESAVAGKSDAAKWRVAEVKSAQLVKLENGKYSSVSNPIGDVTVKDTNVIAGQYTVNVPALTIATSDGNDWATTAQNRVVKVSANGKTITKTASVTVPGTVDVEVTLTKDDLKNLGANVPVPSAAEAAYAEYDEVTVTAQSNQYYDDATYAGSTENILTVYGTKTEKDVIPNLYAKVNLPEIKADNGSLGQIVGDNDDTVAANAVYADDYHYTGNIDKNWSINLIEEDNGVADLIEKAELYKADEVDYLSYNKYTEEIVPNGVYLKVTLKKTWKLADDANLKYYVYVADNKSGKETNKVWVSGNYAPTYEYVNFTWTNDASKATLWKVKDGENGVAVFDFADKAFFQVKMYAGESMYLDLSTAYDKAIAGDFSEADAFFSFDNENANFSRTGTLILVSDDASLVPYQVTKDGYTKVDAEYVKDFAIAHTNEKVNGFVFETKELGNYVLATEEVAEEEDNNTSDNTQEVVVPDTDNNETNNNSKPNPSTGAEDFVGLAVSLAVVSVAAAGALALKK